MSTISVEELHLKDLLKEAILELMQERQDELEEKLAEIIQDLALARAIEEGEATKTVNKSEILQVLERTA